MVHCPAAAAAAAAADPSREQTDRPPACLISAPPSFFLLPLLLPSHQLHPSRIFIRFQSFFHPLSEALLLVSLRLVANVFFFN